MIAVVDLPLALAQIGVLAVVGLLGTVVVLADKLRRADRALDLARGRGQGFQTWDGPIEGGRR